MLTIHPTNIFNHQLLTKRVDIEAGIIKNAKTVNIPATLTASIITIPKVKSTYGTKQQ